MLGFLVYVCLWFRWLLFLFYFLAGMLCILRQKKTKFAQNCVCDCQMIGKYCAIYVMHLCVWGWVLWKSSNENNYDSMRICCLSNRRVKHVFCVFRKFNFRQFLIYSLFSASKDWFSVWVCFSFTSAILFQHFLFFSLFLFTLLSRFNISVFFGTW